MKVKNQSHHFKMQDLVKFTELKSSLPEVKLCYCPNHNKRVSIITFKINENSQVGAELNCTDCSVQGLVSYNLKKYLTQVLDESVQINKLKPNEQADIDIANQYSQQLMNLATDLDSAIKKLSHLKEKAIKIAQKTQTKVQLAQNPLQSCITKTEYIIGDNRDFQKISEIATQMNDRFTFDARSKSIYAKDIQNYLQLNTLKSLHEQCKKILTSMDSLSSYQEISYRSYSKQVKSKSSISTVQSLEEMSAESMTSSCGQQDEYQPQEIHDIWRWGEYESLQHCAERSLITGCCHKCLIIFEKVKSSLNPKSIIN